MNQDQYDGSEELATTPFFRLQRKHRQNGATVLAKSVNPRSNAKLAEQRLRREFEVCRLLQIEGVVRAIDLVARDEASVLYLEDRGGEPLERLLKGLPLKLDVALRVAAKIADALALLHQEGYIHLDLHPSHILFDPDTDVVTLHGLGMATRVPRTLQGRQGAGMFGAPPAYISPELSGRTGRMVDYRTDFYSLGIILFQMLTGRLPFDAEDTLELIHAHVARRPPLVGAINPEVPGVVSDIVRKLLAKSAEERYQGGRGVRHDLDICLRLLEREGKVLPFEIGAQDPPARFELSQRFYGRESEFAKLSNGLANTCKGALSVIMVGGYPGVGKTSLIQEFRKTVFAQKGWFATGKYDLLERTPYRGIQQALRDLWRRLLADEPERVESYRSRLVETVGQNLGVMVEVAPELATIVGETPPVTLLGTLESKNRLHLCFQQTLRALADADHPLVIFLDDLQWADQSSLELIEGTLEKGLDHFLLLGCYRDSEVDARHPLRHCLANIEDKGIPVDSLSLRPLDPEAIRQLVADSLRTEAKRANPLADLVFRKTAGNGFFAKAFLTSIYEAGLLKLDGEGAWEWDPAGIAALETTENVEGLAARKIAQMPAEIRNTIAMAAVLGHPLELANLAAVCETTVEEVEANLIEACRERILIKHGRSYRFEHDHLQESAYVLIPAARRAQAHLRIGRLLAEQLDLGSLQVHTFHVVAHYNRALELIDDPRERYRTARLNLSAGRMAKGAAAFPSAFEYFSKGLHLLPPNAWQDEYALCLALHIEAAEAASLTAEFREADRLVTLVLAHAGSILDKVPAYEIQLAIAHARLLETEALRIALEALQLLGVDIPKNATHEDVHQAALEVKAALETSHSAPSAGAVSTPGDAVNLAAMRLLSQTAVAAGGVDLHLYFMIAHRLFRLAGDHSESPEAPVAYIMAGGMLCYLLDDYENGCRAGDYGMELLNRSTSSRWQAFCHFLFSTEVNCWRLHFDQLADRFAKAHLMGLENGDLMTARTSAYFCCETALHAGAPLDRLDSLIQGYLNESSRLGVEKVPSGLFRQEQVIRSLRQGVPLLSLTVPTLLPASDPWMDHTSEEVSAGHELLTLYLYRQTQAALKAALRAHETPWGCLTSLLPSDFYICLSILDVIPTLVGRERERLGAIAALRQERIRLRARFCQENHQHKFDLVEAQSLRAAGDVEKAREYFDRAIEGARRHRFLHEEALANELAAEFYLGLDRPHIAVFYLQNAVTGYGRWGAWGKLDQLHQRYAAYLSGERVAKAAMDGVLLPQRSDAQSGSDSLDISVIERAAATLSLELDLQSLLAKLMGIVLQGAGAQRGFMLQQEGGEILIEASGSADEEAIQVHQRMRLESCGDISHAIVRYVSRSHETIVIGDAALDGRFAGCPYIARQQPKSILCTPVIRQGKAVAFLYLENNLIRDAFSDERLAAIQIISSQAAVALENARLHDGLKQEVLTRKRAEDDLRQALGEVASLKDKLHAENAYLKEEIQAAHGFDEIVGQSATLRKVLHEVTQVAATDTTVLILGETGTGKELIARAIHSRSARNGSHMVKVNCAALPANLIESELFGHEKGAFTGAVARKLGRFELADGGTVFLDEIGELPLELQAKLLRILQEGEFERVGSTTTLKVNIRVIAATNRDLKTEAENGTFRSDLYYRLSVFPIELPPLRNRTKDIPTLVWYFITKKQADMGKAITKVPKEAMYALVAYDWPGNIRELENVIERAVILTTGQRLTLGDSFQGLPEQRAQENGDRNLNDIERRHIVQVLEQCNWKVKGKNNAAEQLGLKSSTLFFRMKKLGIERPDASPV